MSAELQKYELKATDLSIYRVLPCPIAVLNMHFEQLGLEMVPAEHSFLHFVIAPHIGDLHAALVLGLPTKGEVGTVEVLQSFAVDRRAYIAVCEAARSILAPLGFKTFLGKVNLLSNLVPPRPSEKLDFYEPRLVEASGLVH